MAESIPFVEADCAGHLLHLLPQCAAWWPARKTLFVADVHLGKGAAFRAMGQPVPTGSSERDLQVLSVLIGLMGAQRLVVLGDFWHSRAGITRAVMDSLDHWRAAHRQLDLVLVGGNHDRAALKGAANDALGSELQFQPQPYPLAANLFACHEPPWPVPGVTADSGKSSRSRHAGLEELAPTAEPGASTAAFYLAGHLHPAVRLYGKAHDSLRLPCYVLQQNQLLLPAFGELTGSLTLDRRLLHENGARVAVAAPGAVEWLARPT